MTVSASIVVQFGDTAGSTMLVAELDDLANNNKTSFLTDEIAYFTVYKHPKTIIVNTPLPTAGMVCAARAVNRTKIETLHFINTQSIELSYPPSGSVTVVRWYGNIGANFSVSGFTATITSNKPCICDVSYRAAGYLWQLYPPEIDLTETPEYPVTVLVIGEDA
jgi:hypothetical protein